MKNILIIHAHPKVESYGDAILDSYQKGLKNAKDINVETVFLRNIESLQNVSYAHSHPNEKADIEMLQQKISWCNHMVIITPVWWMSSPALLKNFFDKVLTSGFAFKYQPDILGLIPYWKRFLKGRSARVIYTQGGKQWALAIFGGDSFWKSICTATIWYCGFSPVRRTYLSAANGRAEKRQKRRERFLQKVYKLGTKGK